MLILMRKPGEKVVLELPDGTLITVLVSKVQGRQVHLGFDAPAHVNIAREEVLSPPEKISEHRCSHCGIPLNLTDVRATGRYKCSDCHFGD